MIQQWLLLWLFFSSAMAWMWPEPWQATKPALPWLIAGIMFSIGLMLPKKEVRDLGRHWPSVLGGVTLQYCLMPALALAIGKMFGLSGAAYAGLMVVGCVPGAMASNVLTMNARGHTSYSVSLTTTATMLSPLVTPITLTLALSLSPEQAEGFSAKASSLTLLKTVVAPVLSGYLVQRIFPAIEQPARRACPIVANLLILWVIAIVVALNRNTLAGASGRLILPLVILNVLGYAGGYGGGWLMRLPESMRRALTIEVGMQNAGVGAVLAVNAFGDEAAVGPALYTFGCMATGVLLAQVWRRFPVEGGAAAKSEAQKGET